MFITLLLLAILTVGSASATDVDSMDMSSVGMEDVSLDDDASGGGEGNLGIVNDDVDSYKALADEEEQVQSQGTDNDNLTYSPKSLEDVQTIVDDADGVGDDDDEEAEYVTVDGLTFYLSDESIDLPYSLVSVKEWPEGIDSEFNISVKKDGDEAIVTSWNLGSVDIDREGKSNWGIKDLQIHALGRYFLSFIFTVDGNTKVIDAGYVTVEDDVIGISSREFSTVPEDLSEIFASVLWHNSFGRVIFKSGDKVLYDKDFADFDPSRVDENGFYNIALEVEGEFIFEGLNDGDVVNFQFYSEGNKIKDIEYFIRFGEGTVRFEMAPNNSLGYVYSRVKNIEFSTTEDLGEIFASFIVSEGLDGNVTLKFGDNVIYNKALSDFDSSYVHDNKYGIALEDGGKFIFEGLNDRDIVQFEFFDEKGDRRMSMPYIILLDNNTFRIQNFIWEEHTILEIGAEEFSTDQEDLGTIFASATVPEGETYSRIQLYAYRMDVSGEFEEWSGELFSKYFNEFNPDRIDGNMYQIAFEDLTDPEYEGRFIFDVLKDGDLVEFKLGDWEIVTYKQYKIHFGNNTVRFEEIPDEKFSVRIRDYIPVEVWYDEDYEIIELDLFADPGYYYWVVSFELLGDGEGTFLIMVNNETRVTWNIEWDDIDKYRDWQLKDLNITEPGEYDIKVMFNGEVIDSRVIDVSENVILNIYDDEFSTAPGDLDNAFASVTISEAIEAGNITLTVGDNVIYNVDISDRFRYLGYFYYISLEEDGKFLFEGLNDEDFIKFAFLDENGEELASREFFILFGNNTVRFMEESPIDEIEFSINDMPCEPEGDAVVGYVYIPENDDTNVTVTITADNATYVVETGILIPKFDKIKRAYRYSITLNSSNLNDKDLLNITLDCSDGDNWQAVVEKGETLKFWELAYTHYQYAFYGDLTTGTLYDEPVDPNIEGKLIVVGISDVYGISEGTVTLSADGDIIISKSFSECHKRYLYNICGYVYEIRLDDYDFYNLIPTNKNLTFTFTYGNFTFVQNRMRLDDWVYKINNVQDIADLFTIDVSDNVYGQNGAVVNIIATDYANPDSVSEHVDGGWFNVYVDNVRVPGLGRLITIDTSDELSLEYLSSEGMRELSISLSDLNITSPGVYNIRVTHTNNGYGYFVSAETEIINKNITVSHEIDPPVGEKFDPDLNISVSNVTVGEDAVVTVTTNASFSGVVRVQIGDDNYTVTVNEGYGNDTVSGLGVGTYTAVASFEETEVFSASVKNVTFIVKSGEVVPALVDPALTVSVGNITEGANAIVDVTTNATYTGIVLVQIGQSNYTVVVTNGTGSVPVSGLGVGTYTAIATFDATDIFNESTKNATFAVMAKVAAVIKTNAVITTYGTSKNIEVTLTDANGNILSGKKVIIVFNGDKKELTTNSEGQVTYAIGAKLDPNNYVATISFAGDESHLKSIEYAKVAVNKAKSKLTAKNKSFKVNKAKKYTITLKTDKKKPLKKVKVTIKVTGKKIKISKKTNSKGKIKFNLKKLTETGKFKATVKFAGNKYYKAVRKNVKITVK